MLHHKKPHNKNQNEEWLWAIVAGGGSRQYLGRELQLSDIDKMSTEEINKLHLRYEARLGAIKIRNEQVWLRHWVILLLVYMLWVCQDILMWSTHLS